MGKEAITEGEYRALSRAYDFFNRELFGGCLPHVLVTLQRHAHAKGYFSPERFSGRVERGMAHELALNPDEFSGRSDELILSTLVHEMVHVWQQSEGRAPRRSYHDRQWAGKMKALGLQPTDTGKMGGKETGQSVTHLVIKGGAYQLAYQKLQGTGFALHWESARPDQQAVAKTASKTKFTCPECGQNAWGRSSALLICGECYEESGEAVVMLAEGGGGEKK